ncbi:MAG: 23S rRNA (uracil(1939)-C(5))-methyltransferase RlmD [Clostridia bacterium]
MTVCKNDIIEIEITDISFEGMGFARYNDISIFIANVCLHEKVKAKIIKVHKSYCFAILIEILIPSKNRVESDCDERCGGCTYRHITYEEELSYKKNRILNAFRKSNIKPIDFDVIPSQSISHYRNKIQLPITADENGNLIAGFFAKNSHRIIPIEKCKIQDIRFNEIIKGFLAKANKHSLTNFDFTNKSGLIRHLYLRSSKNEIMLCIVATKKDDTLSKIAKELFDEFENLTSVYLNINKSFGNAILSDTFVLLSGNSFITDDLLETNFEISPASFYQVNKQQTENLYRCGIDMLSLKKTDIVVDFYCGIGTISLCVAKNCNFVYGSEIIKAATDNAKQNAIKNNIKNIEFITGDAAYAADTLLNKGILATAVIVDPPRKGCSPQLIDTIQKMSPAKILYISCSPESLARDIVLFNDKGYTLKTLTAVDMFPRTSHIECVCLMTKNE